MVTFGKYTEVLSHSHIVYLHIGPSALVTLPPQLSSTELLPLPLQLDSMSSVVLVTSMSTGMTVVKLTGKSVVIFLSFHGRLIKLLLLSSADPVGIGGSDVVP